jgi:hypothetical protein
MAETTPEPGAPIPKDAIDPELVKLSRPRPKIGVITALGLVFLSVFFLFRLSPDRRFGGASEQPTRVTAADVVAGKVGADAYVSLEAEPLLAHAIRATTSKGSLGLRVVPARGTGEHLWLVLSGDGWSAPTTGPYVGRLRPLSVLPFAGAVADYAAAHPRPVFAAASAVRAGLATGNVATLTGENVRVAAGDRVAFDVVDPNVNLIVCTFTDKQRNAADWKLALGNAGITPTDAPEATPDQATFVVAEAAGVLRGKLESAKLFAARVDPVTHHYETTWGALAGSSQAGFTVNGTTIPDSELDLVGLYVARGIPSDAFALISGDKPADYWYVLPVAIALAVIALVFLWALVVAVRRDLLAPRVS